MKLTISADVLADIFRGAITSEINDKHQIRIYIPPNSDGLPHVGIYNEANEFISGVVVPEGYDKFVIENENIPKKVKKEFYIPIKVETGKFRLIGYIGNINGVRKDPVTGGYSIWGDESKLLRSFDVYVSLSNPNDIPNDLGFKYIGKFQPGNEMTPYYYVYVHKDQTEALDNDNEN